jgi:hypothetical protein
MATDPIEPRSLVYGHRLGKNTIKQAFARHFALAYIRRSAGDHDGLLSGRHAGTAGADLETTVVKRGITTVASAGRRGA